MKKLLIIASVLFIISCKNSEPKQSESIYNDETVLVVNYQLENMTLDQHAELGSAVAPNFTSENVPGLIGKSFIGDVERGVFGGVYYFSSLESVNTYLESELWKGVVAHPNLVNFKTDIFRTFKGTELANGSHSMRKKSSESSDAENLQILVVNYTNEVNPSDEEMSKQVMEYAPVFSNENFPGMIGKTMINSLDGDIYGGVYYFTNRSAIDDYFSSDLWVGFDGDKNTNVYKKDIYGVAPISSISNGLPIL
ncbi:MAG: YdhR family protein [Flavobacteriaceae bacterium]